MERCKLKLFVIHFLFISATGTSFLESSKSRLFKPSTTSITAAANGYRDHLNEEGETIDDFDKELQQLNDEKRGGEDMSPPPTLDESMSDNDTSLTKIAAVVTSKTWESPQSAIYTSTSRTDLDGAPEIPSSEDTEEAINTFTNETLQEDALDLKQDASTDSIMEVSKVKTFLYINGQLSTTTAKYFHFCYRNPVYYLEVISSFITDEK